MNKSDFHVGQKVYLKSISGKIDPWKYEKVFEGTVTKIGRKFVSVKCHGWEYQFDFTDNFRQKTEFCADYVLFLTEQAVRDYWQMEYLMREMRKIFSYGRVPPSNMTINLPALVSIAEILHVPTSYEEE